MYYYGMDTTKDDAMALEWYEEAADNGSIRAMYNLASMYYFGEGTVVDKDEPKQLFQKVAGQSEDKEVQKLAKKALKKYF